MPRLENWRLLKLSYGEFLVGYIYGDERFDDGTLVRTSQIHEFDTDNHVAYTHKTRYDLGVKAQE